MGALVCDESSTGGSNSATYSALTARYFYAFILGNGWQLASSPVLSYDWKADGHNHWTGPLGLRGPETTILGTTSWEFQFQGRKCVVQPDTLGPDWLVKFTAKPVIKNTFMF
jgi:hypothetical protein